MSKRKKWALRIGLGAVALVLVLLVANLILSFWANSVLEGEIKKVTDKGEPLTLRDIAPEPVPDEDNAALPLEASYLLMVQPEEAVNDSRARIAEDLAGATQGDLEVVGAWLEKNRDCLPLLRKAFARSQCRFDLDYDNPNPLLMELPPLIKIRNAWRLMATEAVLSAHAGRWDDAYGTLALAFRGARICVTEPLLIVHLIRLAMVNDLLDTFAHLYGQQQPVAQARARIDAEIGAMDFREAFHHVLQAERCFGMSVFAMMDQDSQEAVALMTPLEDDGSSPGHGGCSLFPGFLRRLDQAYFLRTMEKVIAMAGADTAENRKQWNRNGDLLDDAPWYSTVSGLILPTYQSLHEGNDRLIARLRLLRLGLAFDAHVETAGAPPQRLADFASGLETRDPFSGKDLLFRVEADGAVRIYSVGPDGKDDNGTPVANAGDREGDLVWVVRGEGEGAARVQ